MENAKNTILALFNKFAVMQDRIAPPSAKFIAR